MSDDIMSEVLERIDNRVAVEPVAVTEFDPPADAPDLVKHLEAHLRAHGELIVDVEERGKIELHRGNTEFNYGMGIIQVDSRRDVTSIAMDRVAGFDEHYET